MVDIQKIHCTLHHLNITINNQQIYQSISKYIFKMVDVSIYITISFFKGCGETFREGGLPVYHPSKLLEFCKATGPHRRRLILAPCDFMWPKTTRTSWRTQRPRIWCFGRPRIDKAARVGIWNEICVSKNRGKTPKMDGLIYENPY